MAFWEVMGTFMNMIQKIHKYFYNFYKKNLKCKIKELQVKNLNIDCGAGIGRIT